MALHRLGTLALVSIAAISHGFTPALTPEKAVEMLNRQYMGLNYWFTPNQTLVLDPKTPLGVTISWAAAPRNFDENIFCHPMVNTSCFKGFADCRMSSSLYNWKMLAQNWTVNPVFGRTNGYVFNQTMVEEVFGKCSYMFDGATENRLNNGCGVGAGADCASNTSAYADICPSTGKTCTANDGEVKGSLCHPYGPVPVPPSGNSGYQCFFSGPALNYPKTDQPNHLSEMVKARFSNELKSLDYHTDNEVVIDERLLVPAIRRNPSAAIPAFIFSKSQVINGGMEAAKEMQKTFCAKYKVEKACPPVIGINDESDFRPNGPFFVPNVTAPTLVV